MAIDVDEANHEEVLPSTPDLDIFVRTVNEDNPELYAAVPTSKCVVNNSRILPSTDDYGWETATIDNAYPEKPILRQKNSKRLNNRARLPFSDMSEFYLNHVKLKSTIGIDPSFMKIVYCARTAQRLLINKKRIERAKGEIELDDVDYDYNNIFEDPERPIFGENSENVETYQNIELDLKEHNCIQFEIVNKLFEMKIRVREWYDNLRQNLEEDHKQNEFDIDEYRARVLDCFESIGKQKLFKDLVGGLEQKEIYRYFLATLMLANTSNVELSNGTGEFDCELQIKLLKKKRKRSQSS